MRKKILLCFLLCLGMMKALPQGSITERKDLHDLLETRRQKFDAYSGSLERKSGFFGNKTKKDVQKSNDVLTDILAIDNHIISLLNRVVDFRNYEKVNRNYDLYASREQLSNLEHAADTLLKQLDASTVLNAHLKTKIKRLQWEFWLLFVAFITVLIAVVRNKYLTRE